MTATAQHLNQVRPQSGQGGFTIIELMIIVAIVSILAVLALPIYQDYAIRSRLSEAMVFVGEARTSVSERFYTTNIMPSDNQVAGLPPPDSYDAYNNLKKLEVGAAPTSGTIVVTIKMPNSSADDKQLQLVPSTVTGKIQWTCEPVPGPLGIAIKYIPANCRG